MINSARRLRNDSLGSVSVVKIGEADTVNETFTVDILRGRRFGDPFAFFEFKVIKKTH